MHEVHPPSGHVIVLLIMHIAHQNTRKHNPHARMLDRHHNSRASSPHDTPIRNQHGKRNHTPLLTFYAHIPYGNDTEAR
jgi:hypothetical protein